MNTIEHLRQQAARAERLARNGMDAVTIERLSAFAAECRDQIKAMIEAAPDFVPVGMSGRSERI